MANARIGLQALAKGQAMTDKLKAKIGRPPKPPEQIAQQVSVRLTPARKVKYLALGGNAWLNKAIDKARAGAQKG